MWAGVNALGEAPRYGMSCGEVEIGSGARATCGRVHGARRLLNIYEGDIRVHARGVVALYFNYSVTVG